MLMNFWWMFDNHTFRELGVDVDSAIRQAEALFEEDPWGSLFVRTDEPQPWLKMDGVHGHGRQHREKFRADLQLFKQAVQAADTYHI